MSSTDEKTIKELYEEFQLNNRIKNLPEMTIRFYEQNLIHFIRFLGEINIDDVAVIHKKVVDQYIMFLKSRELKDNTINTYLRAARTFQYFGMKKVISTNLKLASLKLTRNKRNHTQKVILEI